MQSNYVKFSKKPGDLGKICWTHASYSNCSNNGTSWGCTQQYLQCTRVQNQEGAKSTHQKYHIFNYVPICSNSGESAFHLRSSTAAPGVREILWEPQGAGVFSQTTQSLRAEIHQSRFPQRNSPTHLISCQWSLRLDSSNPPEGPHPRGEKDGFWSLTQSFVCRQETWLVCVLSQTCSSTKRMEMVTQTLAYLQTTPRQTQSKPTVSKCLSSRKGVLEVIFKHVNTANRVSSLSGERHPLSLLHLWKEEALGLWMSSL